MFDTQRALPSIKRCKAASVVIAFCGVEPSSCAAKARRKGNTETDRAAAPVSRKRRRETDDITECITVLPIGKCANQRWLLIVARIRCAARAAASAKSASFSAYRIARDALINRPFPCRVQPA